MSSKRVTKSADKRTMERGAIKRDLAVEFTLPPDLPLHYVDNISVMHTPTDFVVSFFQAQPPLITDEKDWEKVTTIESRCMTRLVISPARFQAMLRILNENWQRYVDSYLKVETNNEQSNIQTGSNEK